jgi:arylsulfatase A-like enzyme
MSGAYDFVSPELTTPEMNRIAGLRKRVMELWEESSNDVLTFELARAYVVEHRPRVLWLGLGQSDDWAHARRYDRLLDYLHLADGLLKELWETVQSLETHRDRTTLVLTTDHGRGLTPRDWSEHDFGIEGSQDIWIAVIGPETPDRGELSDTAPVHQSDVAATILKLLGLDYRELDPDAGPPIEAAFRD